MNALTRICALFLALACFGLEAERSGARAQGQDVYTVSGIVVDETAGSATAAREKALASAHSMAFDRLIQRIVPVEQRRAVPRLSAGDIAPLILSFGIDDEKTSSVRYIGRLTFRFRQAEVRRFLQARGVGFAETKSKPVLLLPVFTGVEGSKLWEDRNVWFDAWKATPPSDGLVPLILPAGDLADVQDISAAQAVSGDTAAINAIASRYGVGAVIVSEASLGAGSVGQQALNITSRYIGGPFDGQTQVRSVEVGPQETLEATVNRAARDIQSRVEEGWQRGNQLDFGRLNELVAVIKLADLREWVEIRARLGSIAFLSELQLVAATREQVAVRLSYYGGAEQLRIALAQRDLHLEKQADAWSLRQSGSGSRTGNAADKPAGQ